MNRKNYTHSLTTAYEHDYDEDGAYQQARAAAYKLSFRVVVVGATVVVHEVVVVECRHHGLFL